MAYICCRTGTPEPEETVVSPDWVMLDRIGRAIYFDDDSAAVHKAALNKDSTAVAVDTASGHSAHFSLTLAAPPKVSYLDLHWPKEPDKPAIRYGAYPYVLAADKDLVLLRISIPCQPLYDDAPEDLFVYTAGPSPSVLRLPVDDTRDENSVRRSRFLLNSFAIGILRLAGDQGRYIVSDLIVSEKKKSSGHTVNNGNNPIFANLCVFSSETGQWRIMQKPVPKPQDQSNGDQFPVRWSTDDVLPLAGYFLCWVNYLSGILLSDFSKINSPTLHFVPFPGNNHFSNKAFRRSCPGRFRSVSISQGMLRFVHIDNDYYERSAHMGEDDDDDWHDSNDFGRCRCRQRWQHPPKSGSKITIWTLNMMDDKIKFKWEMHRVINLDCLWTQYSYQNLGLPQRLPEFPVIAADDPDVLCCLLREKEFAGKPWMIMVDMQFAYLRSCTPYINEQVCCPSEGIDEEALRNSFSNMPLLPAVLSKYLDKPTGDTDKVAIRSSKVVTRSSKVATRSSKFTGMLTNLDIYPKEIHSIMDESIQDEIEGVCFMIWCGQN